MTKALDYQIALVGHALGYVLQNGIKGDYAIGTVGSCELTMFNEEGLQACLTKSLVS